MEALVLWEVSRKQDYIFCSNKLKENIGASIIIEEAVEALPTLINERYDKSLIYHGGGGSLYRFSSRDEAEEFIKTVSSKIIKDYPGLEIFMVIEEYDDKLDKVTKAIDNAYKKLAKKKNRRVNSGALLSFGIEKKCESTGQPASVLENLGDEKRYISREVKTKIDKSNNRTGKFDRLLPSAKGINEFNDITKGEKSYMAVVHIDGNRMGRRFDELKNHFKYNGEDYSKTNAEYLRNLKRFSKEVKNAYEDAFKYMAQAISKNEDKIKDDTYIKEGKFPVIPIIIAGDDITYVTNGKIGIETARIFIEYLNNRKISIYEDKKIKLNACAGVAIAKSTYPFSKAYELAEDLCKNAKKKILEDYEEDDMDFSLIDWHIEQGDLMGSIDDIRKVNYISKDNKKLFMRPLYINNEEKWNNYGNFKDAFTNVTKLKIDGKGLARNKLKNLRKVLKSGEKDTELFLKSNKIENYFSRFENTTGDYCFYMDSCMYYDALEAVDLFIDLDTEEVK